MTQAQIPQILSQHLNTLSLERNVAAFDDSLTPNIDISGDYNTEAIDTSKWEVTVDLRVEMSYKNGLALSIKLQYVATIDATDVSDADLDIFLYLEYPPMLLLELRKVVADTTMAAGVHQVMLDPWDLSRQFAAELEGNKNG
ncbi:MAG: hypothetical protein COA94_01960 [Rickettsiales bacterium]|nr:MAG: hypothetical protein COA94_01960 [Rickettsiales bacterium]